MKRKILSVLLSGSMVLTMAPAALAADSVNNVENASDGAGEISAYGVEENILPVTEQEKSDPETEKVFQVGDAAYATLKDAVDNIKQEKTITLTGDFTGESSSVKGIPENVTLVIQDGASLNLEVTAGLVFMGSEGAVCIEAGGEFIFKGTKYVGTDTSSNIRLEDGSITLSDFDNTQYKFKITLDENSIAEIHQKAVLSLTNGVGQAKNGHDLTVAKGALLSVNGTLKGAGGNNAESATDLTINGTLTVGEQGVLQMSGGVKTQIDATGKLD